MIGRSNTPASASKARCIYGEQTSETTCVVTELKRGQEA
jgi:hypothetical protein